MSQYNGNLLWFDTCDIPTKIKAACAHFRRTRQLEPTIIYLPLSQYDENLTMDGLEIVGAKYVLKNHVEIGANSD